MNPRWLLSLLILMLVTSAGCSSVTPTEAVLSSPTAEPAQIVETEEVLAATNTITPTATQEEVPPPTQVDTETPAPTATQVIIPTVPLTILPNPAAIIARVEGTNSFMLVGGSQNGSWVNADDVAGVLSVTAEYHLHTSYEDLGWITGQSIVYEHICNQYFIKAGPFAMDQSAVGVSGDWEIQPRTPLELSPDLEVYLVAITGWQMEQAPSMPIPLIDKIWKVDLEGNGTDEVFINGTRYAEETGHNVEPRDYSVVLMRTVIGSEVVTIELVGDYYTEEALNQFPLTYTLDFIGDLNGDGKMEVVVGVSRWEGSGMMVFEIDGAQANLVLSVMCSL